jgi:hypothetical protein
MAAVVSCSVSESLFIFIFCQLNRVPGWLQCPQARQLPPVQRPPALSFRLTARFPGIHRSVRKHEVVVTGLSQACGDLRRITKKRESQVLDVDVLMSGLAVAWPTVLLDRMP